MNSPNKEVVLSNEVVFNCGFLCDVVGLKEAYGEYKNWLQDEPDKFVKQNYNKALIKVEKVHPYEQKLASTLNFDLHLLMVINNIT